VAKFEKMPLNILCVAPNKWTTQKTSIPTCLMQFMTEIVCNKQRSQN